MLEETGTVIAGLSGGADSVCLVSVLNEIIKKENLQVELIAVHVNHGIRGKEAKRDEDFARKMCEVLGIQYISRYADIPFIAHNERLSEEEAGRMVRYRIFAEIADDTQKRSGRKAKIAVAHHQNDQAETVLMNMVRGSSLRGICGMRPVRERIIRPLLCVSRTEIEKYLFENGIEYVNDSTNEQLMYTRNRIRKELIPYIENNLNPNAVQKIAELADSVAEAELYIRQQAKQLYEQSVYTEAGSIVLKTDRIKEEPEILQDFVIREMIEQTASGVKDIYRTHIEAVRMLMELEVGKSVSLPYGLIAVKGYDTVSILHSDSYMKKSLKESDCLREVKLDESSLEQVWSGKEYIIPIARSVFIAEGEKKSNVYVVINQGKSSEIYENNDYTKFFDYDKIKGDLSFRFRKAADFMMIDKSGTKKLLKREFIDRKVPKELREDVLLFASQSNVMWAVGVRRSMAGLVTDLTKRVLKISIVVQEDK